MFKKIIFFHIIPFSVACIFFFALSKPISDTVLSGIIEEQALKSKTISGRQSKLSGRHGRLIESSLHELDFIASIKNKNQITLFGSSEFSESDYVSYNFFPKNKGLQQMGIGHAYHQSLSILIELLATHQENYKSKVVFFISPGWFETYGTNSEAFIEFARPNFLRRIVKNDSINEKYKSHIGEYINLRNSDFDAESKSMKVLKEYYFNSTSDNFYGIKSFLRKKIISYKLEDLIQNVDYKIELTDLKRISWNGNFDSIAQQLQNDFISAISSNSLYVNDDYYNQYLIDENGNEKFVTLDPIDLSSNQEYQDFKMLVDYVSERKMEASFIIIPFNPYYYRNVEEFSPLIGSITTLLESRNLNYSNLYAKDKQSYEPAILKDVMHFGNYGWMKVNKYLDSLYYGNN